VKVTSTDSRPKHYVHVKIAMLKLGLYRSELEADGAQCRRVLSYLLDHDTEIHSITIPLFRFVTTYTFKDSCMNEKENRDLITHPAGICYDNDLTLDAPRSEWDRLSLLIQSVCCVWQIMSPLETRFEGWHQRLASKIGITDIEISSQNLTYD
jgi:hypothetical protein